MKNDQDLFDALEAKKPERLTKYHWRQMDPERLHNELREVWALVTKNPGCTLRFIAKELDVPLSRSRKLVDLLLEGGTLTRSAGKFRSLRVSIPLITVEKQRLVDEAR